MVKLVREFFRSRRLKRVGALLALALFVAWGISLRFHHDEAVEPQNNLLVFTVLNLNTLALCVLVVLVARNVVKLIFDRRRGILGSRLRMRLVLSFVGLALIPTSILFVLASGLLNRAMEGWFSNQVEVTKQGAVDVGKYYYQSLRELGVRSVTRLENTIAGRSWSKESLEDQLRTFREDFGFFSVVILGSNGEKLLEVTSPLSAVDNFVEPVPAVEALKDAISTRGMTIRNERLDSRLFVRVYHALPEKTLERRLPFLAGGASGSGGDAVLMLSQLISPDVSYSLNVVQDAYTQYEQLKLLRTPLKSSYLLTLSLITALIIFGAVWIGFYIAREISVPIQLLAEGMTAVAKGGYNTVVREKGDEEMIFLIRSFNGMVSDLRISRHVAEERRGYLETILGNLAVGVVSLDEILRVTALNPAARQLFDLAESDDYIGKPLGELLRPDVCETVMQLVREVGELEGDEAGEVLERELTVVIRDRELKILCSAGRITAEGGRSIGTILLFDDITEISKAQHQAAWRDVARRIAHEIKNPLTPIQLSAQRLQRLIDSNGDPGAIQECTQTIVEHVELIKRLANEFSNFARMPTADFQESDLNTLVSATVMPFAENNPSVVFQVITERRLPVVLLDPEQIRGVLINLLDNAVAAILSDEGARKRGAEEPRITVRTGYDRRRKVASLEVGDNGPGVKVPDKIRIFEPYFTTKKGGTGLGLAVVMSVVSDHQGEIRLYDNHPHGAKFILELPLSPGRAVTQRRLVQP